MAGPAPQAEITVGDIRVVYLPDGVGTAEATSFFAGSTPEGWKPHSKWIDENGRFITTLGGFLIQTAGRNVLLDLGLGEREIDLSDMDGFRGLCTLTGGRLLQSLKAAGLEPEDIDTIAISHLHLEHCGWTSRVVGDSRRLTFPNARHLITASEWNYWCAPDGSASTGHPQSGPGLEIVQQPLENRIEWLEDGQAVAPGVNILATPGHTPGHVSFVVSSGTERAIIFGDVIHCPVQLEETEWSCFYDVDRELAKRSRERLWAELEDPSTRGAGSHFPGFVFGRLVRAQGKRQWNVLA